MTTAPTGARPGRCFPVMSPMSGMARCMPPTVAESLTAYGLCHPLADHLGQGPAGPQPRRLPLAARALLVCGARQRQQATGRATASRRRCGPSPTATRTPARCMAPRSRSECMRRPMLNNASRGQAVYDPFLGSGTSLIAAETTGRICLGLELSPAYVDVIVDRWQAFTGKEAILEGEDRSFRCDQGRSPIIQRPCQSASRGQGTTDAVPPCIHARSRCKCRGGSGLVVPACSLSCSSWALPSRTASLAAAAGSDVW